MVAFHFFIADISIRNFYVGSLTNGFVSSKISLTELERMKKDLSTTRELSSLLTVSFRGNRKPALIGPGAQDDRLESRVHLWSGVEDCDRKSTDEVKQKIKESQKSPSPQTADL